MKSATVRDLRYHFTEIEARLREGEEVEIRKRKWVIARLVPVRPRPADYPDFAARQRKILATKSFPGPAPSSWLRTETVIERLRRY